MDEKTMLGRSSLDVPRLGVGAMTWGEARGLARLHPAQMAYGAAHGFEEEKRAVEASRKAGVSLFDTAAMYSRGASERGLGELVAGKEDLLIATKFPSRFRFRVEDFPEELEASLARLGRDNIDLYQHHYPGRISIPALMNQIADAVDAGKVTTVGVSNYSADQMRQAHAALAERGIPLASNQVSTPSSAGGQRPTVFSTPAASSELPSSPTRLSPAASSPASTRLKTDHAATSGVSCPVTVVTHWRRFNPWSDCSPRSATDTPRPQVRWRCGGSSRTRWCCPSPAPRTASRQPPTPVPSPSR